MSRVSLLLLCAVVAHASSGAVDAESLEIIDEVSYSIDEKLNACDDYYDFHRICALALGGDTLISATSAGIWARFDSNGPWRKLLSGQQSIPSEEYVEFSRKTAWEGKTKGPPAKMWRAPSNDIVMHIQEQLRVLEIREGDRSTVRLCKEAKGFGCRCNDYGYGINSVAVTGDMTLGGCVVWSKDSLLVLQHLTCEDGGRKCRKIFPIPSVLCRELDSLNVRHACSFPVYDSAANVIWVPIWGYEYIYIIDTTGIILDSLPIDRPDYIKPQTAVSRLWTDAVWREWLLRWTPLRSFDYAAPGYFVLQYRVRRESAGADTVVLYSTAVWNGDRQPVELDVDPHWQVAGVQPDGRIIFGHYRVEGDDRRIVLTVARIVP